MPDKGSKLPKMVRLAEFCAVLAFFMLVKALMLYCLAYQLFKAVSSWLMLITPIQMDKRK